MQIVEMRWLLNRKRLRLGDIRRASVKATIPPVAAAPEAPCKLILLRAGASVWREKNKYCGWYDSQLSAVGILQALKAAVILKNTGNDKIDIAYSSLMSRGLNSARIVLAKTKQTKIPLIKTWRLNECHYGLITGNTKAEAAQKFGKHTIQDIFKNFEGTPPSITTNHPFYRAIIQDPRYKDIPLDKFPTSESLQSVLKRVLPLWNTEIVPNLKKGKRVLVVGHRCSMRCLIKIVSHVSDKDIPHIPVPHGIPILYNLDANLNPIPDKNVKFLEAETKLKKAIDDSKARE